MKNIHLKLALLLFIMLTGLWACAAKVSQPAAGGMGTLESAGPLQAANDDKIKIPVPKDMGKPWMEETGLGEDGDEMQESLGTEEQLSEISSDVAEKIAATLLSKGAAYLASRIAVTVAVPLSDFKRETEFGRMLAEYMLTDLANRGLPVTELRLGKEILIVPQTGEFILTRNMGELSEQSPQWEYVIVTTFTNTRSTLIIQGRLIGAESRLVETSWRYSMPLNREIIGLFYDPRELAPTVVEPFSMAVKGLGGQ